ncbi:PAS domain-containing protein [Streptomyces sp. CA-252508]|uniref:PAS domain-containing protein n=1 Tax=Streptomyces sp. CA-252508 TaxID=3418946 RepID=UPI003D940E70
MSSRPSRGAARLAAILDALPDGLVLVNCNGTVVNANTIALEMFETPGTALVGRGLLDLLPAFDSRLIPGSMRRPEAADARGRTKPARMVARRTDGSEFPVEVTSASLEDGREAYDSYGSAYTGDELLMLVVRDLSGTIDTEAELARSQRQTEMILRAASEGVVGTDTDGRIVLVNPAAAQILGWRASDLGGKELHGLMLHSRADGEAFPFEESPLADTLRSGRKHRVRGQVVWAKDGSAVPVDLTTAPVRDGDQLVGAVMTFTDRRPYEEQETRHTAEVTELTERHTAEVTELTERHATEMADLSERLSVEIERLEERYAALAARHAQLTAVLGGSLRGPLEELRRELGTLAADPAGQLWPEANQVLHHLAAGYARMTTLVDNVLGYQRLDVGEESLRKAKVLLDAVVAAGVEGAVELIGPGRVQFAVHAPPIEAEVDGVRISTALAHLIADVAGVDSTGKARVVPGGGYVDSTIVVAAAQRGDVVRIEVRGPYAGGDPVHEPIVRGIVRAHAGVLQTHEVPGMPGSAYVLEVPLGEGSGTVRQAEPAAGEAPVAAPAPVVPAQQSGGTSGGGTSGGGTSGGGTSGGGRRRARRASTDAFLDSPVLAEDPVAAKPTGRRRGRPSPAEAGAPVAGLPAAGAPAEGAVVTAAESAQGRAALGETVPPQGVPVDAVPVPAAGRRARHGDEGGAMPALPAAPAPVTTPVPAPAAGVPATEPAGGRRARRALGPAQDRTAQNAEGGARTAFALPPAEADRRPAGLPDQRVGEHPEGRHDAVPALPGAEHTPSQPHPVQPAPPASPAQPVQSAPAAPTGPAAAPVPPQTPVPAQTTEPAAAEAVAPPVPAPAPTGRRRAVQDPATGPGTGTGTGTGSVPLPPEVPSGDDASANSTQGRAFSVRTLGQGVPFAQQIAQQSAPSSGSGRRRKLATPPAEEPAARPHPQSPATTSAPTPPPASAPAASPAGPAPTLAPQPRLSAPAEGRAYEIGAPDEGAAEGPEPLDGPGGAVEVANEPAPLPVDDELPPEPLDNPRRLLVWPAPDVSTQAALSERGYRPVIVHSREEVDAQIAAFPAALFVDPLTGPITRTALQSLRQAAVAAEVPVLLAAGLGQATREAAYGADPAVLLKALAPRDSEQHPSRVLLIEEQEEIALALTATLERRGMQVARAATDSEAVTLAAQMRPNLVVMDLMQVRRRRAGIIDWLRANGQLNRTPLVVYTSASLQEEELPKLSSGETVLFLAERSTSAEVQARIVDLLAKIGTN